jgi:phosphatidylglycerol:prolipoprotein diacylglycerol transferase
LHKIAFQIGWLTIYWYGILVACGFLAGLWTASRRAPLTGQSPAAVADLGTWLIVGALLGARGYYVIRFWSEQFAGQPFREVFMIQDGGLVFHGGLVGAALAGLVFTRIRGLSFWALADVLAPSIALGHAFGRIGCLMTGCCYGRACPWPWAIRFPADHETGGHPVHPTQLYEVCLNLGLYAVLAWAFRRRWPHGQVFAAYLLGYGALRLTVEFFRGDSSPAYLGNLLNAGQVVSLILVAVGLGLWLWRRTELAKGRA